MLDPNLFNSQQFSSLGNIVTAGLRLYFMRFKPSLRMAVAAHLWLLMPLYGWAKYCALSALLAQQSFHDLVRSPESIASARQQSAKRGWSILITNVIIIVMVVSIAILAFILIAFIFGMIAALIPIIFSVSLPSLPRSNPARPFEEPVSLAIGLGGSLFLLVTAIWVYARYFIVELPLTLECNYKPIKALRRCRNLTKGSTVFIFGIITIVFVLTCPLSYLVAEIFFRLIRLMVRSLPLDFSIRQVIGYSLFALLCLVLNAVTMPFWQATKAVLYYSLRSRREGFDLQIRDGNLPSERA